MKSLKKNTLLFASLFMSMAALGGLAIVSSTKSEVIVDSASAAVGNYYDNADTSSRENLISSLNTITSNGFKSIGYGSLKDSAYATTESLGNGFICDYYQKTHNYKLSDSGSSASKVGQGWNKEHTIPQSYWGGGTSSQGCDCIIVLPTDIKCNSERGNLPYGETSVSPFSADSGCKKGTSKLSGYNGTVFEPLDEYKGDLARIYMYAIVRWNGYKFTSSEGSKIFSGSLKTNYGFTKYGLDLMLKWHQQDPVSDWEKQHNDRVQQVQKNRNPFVDHPEWVEYIWGTGSIDPDPPVPPVVETPDHKGTAADPYSCYDAQIASDSAPSDAYVVGEVTSFSEGSEGDYKVNIKNDDGKTYYLYWASNQTSSQLAVGKIVVAHGPLKVFNGTKEMDRGKIISISDSYPSGWILDNGNKHVTSVTVSGDKEVGIGKTIQLTATIAPSDAKVKGVQWRSDNAAVATVDQTGKVTGVSEGTVTIRAISNDRSVTGAYTITVKANGGGQGGNNGCNGSIVACSSIVVSTLAAGGMLFLIKRRKED